VPAAGSKRKPRDLVSCSGITRRVQKESDLSQFVVGPRTKDSNLLSPTHPRARNRKTSLAPAARSPGGRPRCGLQACSTFLGRRCSRRLALRRRSQRRRGGAVAGGTRAIDACMPARRDCDRPCEMQSGASVPGGWTSCHPPSTDNRRASKPLPPLYTRRGSGGSRRAGVVPAGGRRTRPAQRVHGRDRARSARGTVCRVS
jgi:hypothetical protein